jgi:hypothetical protein
MAARTRLVAKYSLDKPQAQRDVDTFVKGRQNLTLN